MVSWMPHSLAMANFSSQLPAMITLLAPAMLASWAASWPIGPSPITSTVRSVSHEPGETYARVEVAMPDYDDAQFVTVILVDPNPTAELDASDKKDSSLRRRRER